MSEPSVFSCTCIYCPFLHVSFSYSHVFCLLYAHVSVEKLEWYHQPSSRTGDHPPTLWRTTNWLTTWMCFTAGLISPHLHTSSALTPPHPLPPLTSPHWHPTYTQDLLRVCVSTLSETENQKTPGPDSMSPSCLKVCADQLVPSYLSNSTDLCSCAKFPHASDAPQSSWSPRNPPSQD